MKVIKTILITTVLCLCYITIFAQKDSLDIYRISKEQKIFEFSQIYRELYYNFANMDNCPEVNIDSLYFSLIPYIINSEDGELYFLEINPVGQFDFISDYCGKNIEEDILKYLTN